jgi:tetratricopeptide (TPR) repeat protein
MGNVFNKLSNMRRLDGNDKAVYQLNLEGCAESTKGNQEASLLCYLMAIDLDPTQWLAYQNAGHSCIEMKRWRAAAYFHRRTKELDPNYDKRPEKDKCSCLKYALDEVRKLQEHGTRIW